MFGGWKGLKRELQQFFTAAKPHSAQVLHNHNAKIQLAREQSQVPKFHAGHSASSAVRVTSESETKDKENYTLQEMFRRQMEFAPATKNDGKCNDGAEAASTSSLKTTNKSNSPMNLKAFFDRQIAAARSSEPGTEDSKKSDSNSTIVARPVDALKSHRKSQHTTQISATEPISSSESHCSQVEDHLCVVCEDAKKDVILLPCKHLCLCKSCSNFDLIKECPM